jgi:hypothetical protein
VRHFVEHLPVKRVHEPGDVLVDVVQYTVDAWAPGSEISGDLLDGGDARICHQLDRRHPVVLQRREALAVVAEARGVGDL